MLKEYYKRALIGKSTVANGTTRIPKRVIENYNIKKGDQLEFYPSDADLPNERIDDIMAVMITRATTSMAVTTFGGS
jgi:bifunctional DNA-binding transcriptional regulator/antitoxin component of YhaV-PrlF toxin-antitoxin module